jgi:hypothetical protein
VTTRDQRTIELLLKYGAARFGDDWWPGNARQWLGADGRELEYLLDPGSAELADDPQGSYDGPPDLPPEDEPLLPDGVLVYLSSLVASDIRKRTKSIDGFAPKDGQDPAEAADALTRFISAREWRRRVLALLADLTQDPALWRAGAVDELPEDYDPGW